MSFRNWVKVLDKSTKKYVYSNQIFGNHDDIPGIEEFVISHFGESNFDKIDGLYYKNAANYSEEDDHLPLVINSDEVFNEFIELMYKTDVQEFERWKGYARSTDISGPPKEYDTNWLMCEALGSKVGEQTVDFLKAMLILGALAHNPRASKDNFFCIKPDFEVHIEGY